MSEGVYMNYKIIRIADTPHLTERAAEWFHKKWGIPYETYLESMETCRKNISPVPQWYIALDENGIIGGLGVIENDFHERKDLTPNVCAVYVEENKRCRGVAWALLDYACTDMEQKGIDELYLVTDHTSFYERYGWEFLCRVHTDGETNTSRMYVHRSRDAVTARKE